MQSEGMQLRLCDQLMEGLSKLWLGLHLLPSDCSFSSASAGGVWSWRPPGAFVWAEDIPEPHPKMVSLGKSPVPSWEGRTDWLIDSLGNRLAVGLLRVGLAGAHQGPASAKVWSCCVEHLHVKVQYCSSS